MTISSNNDEIVTDFYPYYQVYKDGRVHRFYELYDVAEVPPSPEDPTTGVSSKDINISPDISARLYLPKNIATDQKLPILVYYHGGGLVVGSAFFQVEHRYLNILVSQSNCIAISVNYRLAPEHDLPTLYQDCWTAIQWVASHADNNKNTSATDKDTWITNHGDLSRVSIAGDSGGGNIVFNMVMRAGRESLYGDMKILGAIFCCPFLLFPSVKNIEKYLPYKLWNAICPSSEPGINSPMINPVTEKGPSLAGLGCSRIFLCTGEKDELIPREIGILFAEAVKKSGWKGELEFIEVEGEGHCFQLAAAKLESEKTKDILKRMACFIQRK